MAWPFVFGGQIMLRGYVVLCSLGVLGLVSTAWTETRGTAFEQDKGKANGIVIDKKDNLIKIKVDDDKDVTTYTIDGSDKQLANILAKGIFPVARVRLTYKTDGDKKVLTGIERIGPKKPGTVTGEVLGNYKWWIEVKPKDGPPDGYACSYPKELWEATEAYLKELKKGDTVMIQYFVDFERNRIKAIKKINK
jgi:hypothetical protein